MAHDTAILDIGSSQITVLIGERGVNGTICINGMGVCDYDGFAQGEWLDPEHLPHALAHAINSAQSNSGVKINHIYVGVPGEFTSVVCKEAGLVLGRRRKVTDTDVFNLMNAGDNFDEQYYEVINIQPIYYSLDNDRRTVQPVGVKSSKLGGILSYVLAETSFTAYIRKILNDFEIQSVDFVSSVLAESLLLFDEEERDKTAVLIDIGYITSTVAVVRGDGLLALNSFSMGGGHISGDLATVLGISFTDAESLKRKVILSINAGENDIYEINGKNGVKTLPAKYVNEIVAHRVSTLAKNAAKCLSLCEYEIPDYIPFSLTGGGIGFIRGARDILSAHLGRDVEVVSPRLPQVGRPNLSSSWGLLNMAINNEEPAVKKGFFARLFKK